MPYLAHKAGPDGHRIISFGAVTVRHGNFGAKWSDFVNLGISIDAATMGVQG